MAPGLRPAVVVSRCLGFDHCRYDGGVIESEFVRRLGSHVALQLVCPEVAIGLGVPRSPILIARTHRGLRLIQPRTGRDLTDPMQTFVADFLGHLGPVDGFILASRSPSCGTRAVPIHGPEPDYPVQGQGAGFFGAAVVEQFPLLPVDEDRRLANQRRREHFLTRLFAHARFRTGVRTMKDLVQFHATHKLLLMGHHQVLMRRMGRLVANPDRRPVRDVRADYGVLLDRALATPARAPAVINVLMHALGYFKKRLRTRDKELLLDALEQYRAGRAALSLPVGIIGAWVARFGEPYLAGQLFFVPYPADLAGHAGTPN